jgi:hypothetical protein
MRFSIATSVNQGRSAQLSAEFQFIDTKLSSIEGWLLPEAAQLTVGLMLAQHRQAIDGPVLEIGVWRGKYLALLFHGSKERVVGIDIFEYGNTPEEVAERFRNIFGDAGRLTLVRADSRTLSPSQVINIVGTFPRFVSIDGAHTPDAVCHDLELAAALLDDHGIIALDDFLNSRAIGVSEGTYRYFLDRDQGRLVPFAYCGNKLFLARRKAADFYIDATLQFLSENADLPVSQNFAEFAKQGDAWVRQELLGVKCLIVT